MQQWADAKSLEIHCFTRISRLLSTMKETSDFSMSAKNPSCDIDYPLRPGLVIFRYLINASTNIIPLSAPLVICPHLGEGKLKSISHPCSHSMRRPSDCCRMTSLQQGSDSCPFSAMRRAARYKGNAVVGQCTPLTYSSNYGKNAIGAIHLCPAYVSAGLISDWLIGHSTGGSA